MASTLGKVKCLGYTLMTQFRKRLVNHSTINSRHCCSYKHQNQHVCKSARHLSTHTEVRKLRVLGIETSCDDTGAAVVNHQGNIIGEALHSQTMTHNQTGGIIPNIAKELHAQNVETVVQQALENSRMQVQDLDAIAVTVKPGLIMSLRVGLRYAQKLALTSGVQLIPIHHMEAHALTARMLERVDFPFMVLLASGGHCLLAVARDVDDFQLLGGALDSAPGEAYDKTARELNLFDHPDFAGLSGGVIVERLAQRGNPHAFPRVHIMNSVASCNFSFSGLKNSVRKQILEEYERLGVARDQVLPNVEDVCAWFQHNLLYHTARRLQRAFIYSDMYGLIPEETSKRKLVLSGGVASNQYLRQHLGKLCADYDYSLICPPPKLCTDNGVMIAWNGVEKLLCGRNFSQDPESVDVVARSPLGEDISKDVSRSSIKLPKLVFN